MQFQPIPLWSNRTEICDCIYNATKIDINVVHSIIFEYFNQEMVCRSVDMCYVLKQDGTVVILGLAGEAPTETRTYHDIAYICSNPLRLSHAKTWRNGVGARGGTFSSL